MLETILKTYDIQLNSIWLQKAVKLERNQSGLKKMD